MPTNTANDNFANRLMNNQSPEAVLTLQLTNFKLQMKEVDKRVQGLENSAKVVIQNTQSSISKLVKSIFKSDTVSKDETISETEIKKSLDNDTANIKNAAKKRTDDCNKGICSKISVLKTTIQKSLSKTVAFFGDVIGGKYFTSNSNLLGKFFKSARNNIKAFFGSTVGKMFDWVYSKGSIVFDLLSKLVSPITSVLKWLASGAISIIEGLYNKFVVLAKIGWKVIATVWDVISEKTKTVAVFFKDMFMEVLSSPIGFVLAVVGFALAIKFVLKPLINMVIKIGKFIWSWVLKKVDKLFFNNDAVKRTIFFDKHIKTIRDFFSNLFDNYLTPAYDKTIGALTGITSQKIKKWFEKDGVITQYWEKAKKLFSGLISTEIKDDISFTWSAIKDLYYIIKSFVDGTDSKVEKRKDELRGENKTRLEALTKQKLSDLANSYIFEQLYTFYYQNKVLWGKYKKDEIFNKLSDQAEILYNNFKKTIKLSIKDEETQKYVNMIDVNINELVSNIINKNETQLTKIIDENKVQSFLSGQTLNALQKYFDDPSKLTLLDEVHNTLNSLTDVSFTVQAVDRYKKLQDEDKKFREGKINQISVENSMIITNFDKLNSKIKLVSENLSFKAIHTIDKEMDKLQIKQQKLKKTIDNYKKSNQSVIQILAKQPQKFNSGYYDISVITHDAAEQPKKPSMLSVNYDTSFAGQKDGGIIAKFPTKVLIAEAGHPELIVPINKDGINFINESIVSVLNQEIYNNNNNSQKEEKSERESIVKRIRKQQPKPDSKIYDMKNISYGVIGVSR